MSKQRGTAAYRGFTVSHQRVVLDLSFSGTVVGFTELTIVPTHRSLRTIHLNCRQASVQSATINNLLLSFRTQITSQAQPSQIAAMSIVIPS